MACDGSGCSAPFVAEKQPAGAMSIFWSNGNAPSPSSTWLASGRTCARHLAAAWTSSTVTGYIGPSSRRSRRRRFPCEVGIREGSVPRRPDAHPCRGDRGQCPKGSGRVRDGSDHTICGRPRLRTLRRGGRKGRTRVQDGKPGSSMGSSPGSSPSSGPPLRPRGGPHARRPSVAVRARRPPPDGPDAAEAEVSEVARPLGGPDAGHLGSLRETVVRSSPRRSGPARPDPPPGLHGSGPSSRGGARRIAGPLRSGAGLPRISGVRCRRESGAVGFEPTSTGLGIRGTGPSCATRPRSRRAEAA
jgi:hypothetical protein